MTALEVIDRELERLHGAFTSTSTVYDKDQIFKAINEMYIMLRETNVSLITCTSMWTPHTAAKGEEV
jgi:hypothetical protein